jgi:dTMP kinase
METIDSLARILDIPDPDATILLDIDPDAALARARFRNRSATAPDDEGRFEDEDISFHRDVRAAYLDLARRHPRRFHVIDASGTPDAVFARILPLLERWISER